MHSFANKRAIVTGGASGIGRELSKLLAREGAAVFVADINKEGADQTVAAIAGSGGTASAVLTDMRDPDAVNRLVETATADGPLDYMFNNAGVIMFGEFRDMAHDDWRHFIDSDLMSVVYGTDCAYRVMREQGFGHIVNVSSVFGLFPFAIATGYTAVKQAVVGLSLALRPEAAGLGVKVSVACPGTIETEVRKSYKIFNGDRDAFNKLIWKQMPPDKAAAKILKGVRKNKGLIAFPFYDTIFWYLYRICPALNFGWQRILVNLFRKRVRHQ